MPLGGVNVLLDLEHILGVCIVVVNMCLIGCRFGPAAGSFLSRREATRTGCCRSLVWSVD